MAAPAQRGRLKTAVLVLAAAGTQVLEAAVAGQRISVVSFSLATAANTALPSFESSVGTVLAGPYDLGAGGGLQPTGSRKDPLFWTAVGEGLTFRTAGAGLTHGVIMYLVETNL
jgi:hypothetical protein